MKKCLAFFMRCVCLYSSSLSAVTFFTIDTTSPLQCYLSSQFQNRVMIENGRIKKVIASENERLSIQMEEITGQVFIYARDTNPKETSISIVSDTGVIQDIQIHFLERTPEVVILQDPEEEAYQENEQKEQQNIADNCALILVEEILSGNIPSGYIPCSITYTTWMPKKGIKFELKTKLEGPHNLIYIYEATNTLKQRQTLLECELECEDAQWVFLETNILKPKQKILSIISVAKYE